MIEIEKKFRITKEQEEALVYGAEFFGEKKFTDTYFDTSDWSLTLADKWLRLRDDQYELKMPLNKLGAERVSDRYHEYETEQEIRDILQLPEAETFAESLVLAGITPFCTITTTRKKYKKDGFGIDVDSMDFGYEICELEKMIADEKDISSAENEIIEYAKAQGFSIGRVRGKVLEYLFRNNPAHCLAVEAVQ